jgi:hypothetical protein
MRGVPIIVGLEKTSYITADIYWIQDVHAYLYLLQASYSISTSASNKKVCLINYAPPHEPFRRVEV